VPIGGGSAQLREALMEEDSWRKGLKWYLGSCENLRFLKERGPAPRLVRDPYFAQKLPNGNYLITDYGGSQVLEITEDYEIVWEFGKFSSPGSGADELSYPRKAVYNPELNTVLISDTGNRRVIELDYDTRAVLHTLSSSEAGPFGELTADYVMRALTTGFDGIIVADHTNHYVAVVDWDGRVVWDFGTYGVSGSTLSLLDLPWSAIYNPGDRRFYISDYNNNRVLKITLGGVVEGIYPIPRPRNLSQDFYTHYIGIGSIADIGILIEPAGGIVFFSPHRTNHVMPTTELAVLTSYDMSVYEYDLRSFKPFWRRPNSIIMEFSLDADEESKIIPALTLGTRKVTVIGYSTQSATLNVYMPNARSVTHATGLQVDPSTPWLSYASESIPAGGITPYIITAASPVIGVSITMGASAGDVKIMIFEE